MYVLTKDVGSVTAFQNPKPQGRQVEVPRAVHPNNMRTMCVERTPTPLPPRRSRLPSSVTDSCDVHLPDVSISQRQGDLSLDHYDDSQHSRGSLVTGGFSSIGGSGSGGIGPVGGGLTGASNGITRKNFAETSSSAVPWGSGMGGSGGGGGGVGGGKNDSGCVVPGGIWLPTPRTQGTSSFSPSSSVGGAGAVAARTGGTGGGSDVGKNAATGGFFGSDEPRCARCSNTDASGQAQVGVCHLDVGGR